MTSEVNEDTTSVFAEETFVSNGEEFKRTTYNGISVIRDSYGYYNISNMCRDNGKIARDWIKNSRTQEVLNIRSRQLGIPIFLGHVQMHMSSETKNSNVILALLYKRDNTYADEAKGWFAHWKLISNAAYWCNTEYGTIVDDIMDLHDEINHLKQQTLQDTITDLTAERDILKAESEAKDKKIETLESQVATLTTPINNLQQDYLYAKQYGDYFLLKYSDSNPTQIKGYLNHVTMVNAKDVRKLFLQHAKVMGLVERVRHVTDIGTYTNSWMSKVEDLARVFEMLKHVKVNAIDSFTVDGTMDRVAKSLAEFKLNTSNRYYRGKIFEYEYALQHQLIPIEFMPQFILNRYKMSHRDKGVDLFKIENNEIVEIYQLKLRSGGYITKDDLTTFLLRCEDTRFSNCKKKLILKGCNISKRLQKQLLDIEIEMI